MKFLAFFACEKVIIDKNGAHSFINMMLNVEIQIPPQNPQQIPPNAVTPQMWFLFSLWAPSPEEVGKTFEQVFQIYWPNGDKFHEARLQFKPDENYQQTSLGLNGLPVGQAGLLRLVTWVEDHGQRISDIVEYHTRIKHPAPLFDNSPVTAVTN
jgi:hypothetical protein